MKTHVEALRKAIELAGSQAKLASAIAVFLNRPTFKQQTVSYWVREGTLVGPEYWPAIEHATGGRVTRADLRPDVFSAAA
jgi:DNA-binding transcriptional regulator YdaS (Cro superfamily)